MGSDHEEIPQNIIKSPLLGNISENNQEYKIFDDYNNKKFFFSQINNILDKPGEFELFEKENLNQERIKSFTEIQNNITPFDEMSSIAIPQKAMDLPEQNNEIDNDNNINEIMPIEYEFNEQEEININNNNTIEIIITKNNSYYQNEKENLKDILLKYFNNKHKYNKGVIKNKFNIWKNQNKTLNVNDKKNLFKVFTLFNPKGETEDLKKTRNEINEVLNRQNKKDNILSNSNIFKVLHYNNIKKKEKIKRKQRSDEIRKKIKSRFLKSLKNRMNENLIRVNSEKLFDFLPQCFICSINKKRNNKSILNMTIKELMSTDFFEIYNNKNYTNNTHDIKYLFKVKNSSVCPDKKKYQNNCEVIRYLEKNDYICKNSNFNVFGNMTFIGLFNEYLESKEFEEDIIKLKIIENNKINNNPEFIKEYIDDYIIKAYNFINYFLKSN